MTHRNPCPRLRGNSTSSPLGMANYVYDQANRLVTSTSGTTTVTNTFNADGLRMRKNVNGMAQPYVYDTSGELPLMLMDGNTFYIYGPDGVPIEQINGTTPLYYHQDQLGSTRLLSTANIQAAATYSYDAHGRLTATTGSAVNPFRFAGQYTDSETALVYLRARFYDPSTAQFMSVDPKVEQSRTSYGYADNDPINRVDPTGQLPSWNAVKLFISELPGVGQGIAAYQLGRALATGNGIAIKSIGAVRALASSNPVVSLVSQTADWWWYFQGSVGDPNYVTTWGPGCNSVSQASPQSASLLQGSGSAIFSGTLRVVH